MKDLFPGYFHQTADEYRILWDNALIVLDANVLLDLYRYSPKTRDELLNILAKASDRLWLPHQVALEFSRNRPEVVITNRLVYEKVNKYFNDLKKSGDEFVAQGLGMRLHPYLDLKTLLEPLYEALHAMTEALDEKLRAHPDYLKDDSILDCITDLLVDKIGAPYTDDQLKEIHVRGKQRYEAKIPPGYADKVDKKGTEQYGDLVIWQQIIDQATNSRKPIIFITNDSKEDWWWEVKGRTLGPRPELVEELMREAGTRFQMYTSDRFLEYAKEYLNVAVQDSTVDEVREVKESDAEREAQEDQLLVRRLADPTFIDDRYRAQVIRKMEEPEHIQRMIDSEALNDNQRAQYNRVMADQERVLRLTDPAFMDERMRAQYNRMMADQDRALRLTDPAFMNERMQAQYNRMMADQDRGLRLTDPAFMDERMQAQYNRMMADQDRALRLTDPAFMNERMQAQFNLMIIEREQSRRLTDPAVKDESRTAVDRRRMVEQRDIQPLTDSTNTSQVPGKVSERAPEERKDSLPTSQTDLETEQSAESETKAMGGSTGSVEVQQASAEIDE